MSLFIPSKLSVSYLPPATPFRPLDNRKYTLTHSDTTGELFLTIGCQYDKNKINMKLRDEVLAEWLPQTGEFQLWGNVYISGGEFDESYAKVRFMIFQKELELAIKAIVYGDQSFYSCYPWLLDSPIYIRFDSVYPQFQQVLYYGTPRQYLTAIFQQPVIKT
ncbi:staygreen family protein [Neobacillus sp. D3-1R]|uniref:staygreen family protein n=1 Tax=Neobacillus sp. D3-1R TaxID=3445778 RepID=UPI003F9ED392